MKRFECPRCGQPLHFEAQLCASCATPLCYDPETRLFRPREGARLCDNLRYGSCVWIASEGALYCAACRHNRVVPDLTVEENLTRWRRIEIAKHRLFYGLMRLGLPLQNKSDREDGLAFDFLAEMPDAPVFTGHQGGLVTINLAEADDLEREKQRAAMHEPYRTLLGHFRHEVGHHFWDVLAQDRLEAFRALFGDERADYTAALQRHYAHGAPNDWDERHISAYASSHPHEDFAETWAHYLHMVDTLETAAAFGLSLSAASRNGPDIAADIAFDPYCAARLDQLIEAWIPLTYAMNSISRSMGQPDLYPFALSPVAIAKLAFVHALVRGDRAERDGALAAMAAGLSQPNAPVG